MNAPLSPVASAPERAERRRAAVAALGAVLPPHALLWRDEETGPYECDGLTAYRELPMAVCLPENEGQVIDVLRTCHQLGVPVVARGAGTGLSGGAMPHAQGVVLSLARFNRILRVDREARLAVVQPGVRNLAVSEAAAPVALKRTRSRSVRIPMGRSPSTMTTEPFLCSAIRCREGVK